MKPAEWKRAERARRKAEGWVRFEAWIKPSWLLKIRALIERLEKGP